MQSLRYVAAASALFVAPITLMGCGSSDDPAPSPSPIPAPSPSPSPDVPSPPPTPISYGDCEHVLMGTPFDDSAEVPTAAAYATALEALNMDAVKQSMRELLVNDNPCWPADNAGQGPNYGGLMIRLAWHCAGTFRNSDQKGGCGGGRQRFEPERSWPDNANLDKARALLYPMKAQYGDALSWGDLFILAGTVAYEMAGAPISKMCFGRVDQTNGADSMILNEPCNPVQGDCAAPHGATTVGLIYVNPEGPLNTSTGMIMPQPALSVAQIRRTFGTMGHTDEGTVALIGGGHTIGKTHGACNPDTFTDPFNPPNQAFTDGTEIWKGQCGSTGKGPDAFTSGFEGAWTTNYFTWTNDFFTELVGMTWYAYEGPGGATQWKTDEKAGIIRLTADMALLEDSAYSALVDKFAANITEFGMAFDDAWFRLTTTNVGGEWSTAAKCTDGSTPMRMRSDAGPEFVV